MGLSKLLILCIICLFQNKNRFIDCSTSGNRQTKYIHSNNNQLQLITLDIKNKFSTEGLQYVCSKSRDRHTYTATPGFLINKVTKRDTVLWDAKDYGNQYSSKVFVGLGERGDRIFRVYFPTPFQVAPLEPPKPIEPKTTKPIPITLDVKIKRNTDQVQYEYDAKEKVHTFTPLLGFVIERVVKGKHQMLKCEDGIYPEKALILPDERGEPVLRLQLPKPVPKDIHEQLLKQPLNLNDPRCLDLDTNNILKSDFYTIKINYSAHGDVIDFVYTPKGEYRFKSVKDKSCVIWKADEVSDCATKVNVIDARVLGYINLVIFTPGGNKKFTKTFSSRFFSLVENGKWEETTQTIVHN